MDLRGVFPPIPTPFNDGEVHVEALRANLRRWLDAPLAGIVVLGSNGEAPLLDEDEADRVIEVAREEVPRDRLLIAGTGRESTRATIAATRRAAHLGADAVLVRTPAFFKSQISDDVLVAHYRALADASPIPVILYNFTAVTGVNMLPGAVSRCAEHENIIGIKESGGDIAQIAELVTRTPDTFQVVVGSAPTYYASLCVGAVGGILALACVVPEQCVVLHRLIVEGRHQDALALQRRLTPLAHAVTSTYGVPGLKAALDQIGYFGGTPRPPLTPVRPPAVDVIRRHLHELSTPISV